jgi:hypothetical protein
LVFVSVKSLQRVSGCCQWELDSKKPLSTCPRDSGVVSNHGRSSNGYNILTVLLTQSSPVHVCEILIGTELATGPRKANNQTKFQIDGTKRLSDSESRGDPGESDSRPLAGIMVWASRLHLLYNGRLARYNGLSGWAEFYTRVSAYAWFCAPLFSG